MATTATLEATEVKGMEAPRDADNRNTVVRYFKIHRDAYDSLKPTKGDTHSVSTDQVVISSSKQQPWGPMAPAVLMVVVYETSDLRTVGP